MTVRTALAGSSAPHTSRSQAFMTWDSWSGYGTPETPCLAAMRPFSVLYAEQIVLPAPGLISASHSDNGVMKCQTPIPL